MAEQTLLKAGEAEITTKVVKFGPISYQVSNIGSVAVYLERKFNPIAVVIFIAAAGLGFYAYQLSPTNLHDAQVVGAVAATAAVIAIVIQFIWPKKVYTFVLKTSSNDVHKIVSENGEYLTDLQGAIEQAFVHCAP